jgi:MoxR-like ATPase
MNTNLVTLAVAKQIVEHVLSRGLVPMVSGSPGLGKSDMIHQIAKERNLMVIDVRLSQCDPTDLNVA